MVRKLLLLRHAKTKESEPGQKDFDRPLMAEGTQDVSLMGKFLFKEDIKLDKLFSSNAVRARETAELISEQVKFGNNQIRYEEELYDASVRTFLSVINTFNESWNTVMMIGHNPTITYISEYLSKADIGKVQSCGLVILAFKDLPWNSVSEGTADFLAYHYPNEIREKLA